jgi:hypothetical protein
MFDTGVQRLIGMVAHKQAVNRTCHWARLDGVTANQLETALQDVRTGYQMTEPMSVVVKFEYLIAVDELNRVEELRASHQRLADDFGSPDLAIPPNPVLFLEHEPELTRRLLQHQAVNLLQFVDLPACDQPRSIRGLKYFDSPPLPGSRLLSPAEFESHCSQAPLATTHLLRSLNIGFGIQEQALQSALEATLAAQRYRRDFGELPETLSQLVVAGMLRNVPRDPWGKPGAELHYEQDVADRSRARVWSVGANGVDDGGRIDVREYGVGDEGLWIGKPPVSE